MNSSNPPPTPAPKGKFFQGFWASLVAAGVLGWVFLFQRNGQWWHQFTAQPLSTDNLVSGWGYAFLHGSTSHLLANAMALLVLGTLAYGLYPRATVRALPVVWLTSYLVIWALGQPGSSHLGASGITYGLMALVGTMGVLRRERPAMGASLVVWFLFGGAWWAMLPGFPEVSWEGHLGGATGGVLAALLWKNLDPTLDPPVELEDDEEWDFIADVPPHSQEHPRGP